MKIPYSTLNSADIIKYHRLNILPWQKLCEAGVHSDMSGPSTPDNMINNHAKIHITSIYRLNSAAEFILQRYFSPEETPDSYSDMGRILSLAIRPAPLWRAPL